MLNIYNELLEFIFSALQCIQKLTNKLINIDMFATLQLYYLFIHKIKYTKN